MNIENIFNETMIEVEFSTFWEVGGDLQPRFIKTVFSAPITGLKIEFQDKFTSELKKSLTNLYEQVGYINLLWDINLDKNDQFLLKNEWVKKKLLSGGVQVESIKHELGGTLNIVPFEEMMNPNEWLKSPKYPKATFLPFDRHWELVACFKEENGIIEDNIYLLNIQDNNVVNDMQISLFRYLELAYKAKCFFSWQMAYLYPKGFDNEKLRILLPLILPHVTLDLADFS